MEKEYVLACDFNTVRFKVTEDELYEYGRANDLINDYDELDVSWEELEARYLQEQYDILASIKTKPPVKYVTKPAEPETPKDPPTEAQINKARSLGIKNPEKMDKETLRAKIGERIKELENKKK